MIKTVVSTAAVFAFSSAVTALFSSVVDKAREFVVDNMYSTIVVYSGGHLLNSCIEFAEHCLADDAKGRHLEAATRLNKSYMATDKLCTKVPCGVSLWVPFEYEGSTAHIEYTLDSDARPLVEGQSAVRDRCVKLRTFSRSTRVLEAFLKESLAFMKRKREGFLSITVNDSEGYWSHNMRKTSRPLRSIKLHNDTSDEIVSFVREFLESRDAHESLGVPWRTGIMLSGVAGSGKTSLVGAIAAKFGCMLRVLKLSGETLNDHGLERLMQSVLETDIVLIEDIDCAFAGRTNSDGNSKLTFSGLLNAIDGLSAAEGRLIVITTNHPERLDPALIRPGRIDRRFEFGYAKERQVRRLFVDFYVRKDDPPVGETLREELEYCNQADVHEQHQKLVDAFPQSIEHYRIPMSFVQTHFLRYRTDAAAAIENVPELLAEVEAHHAHELAHEERSH